MRPVIYKNAKINGTVTDITVENGIFKSLSPTSLPGIDLGGKDVFPGLIDIHSHGCIGFDTMTGHLKEMARFQAENGVTTWYPTTCAASREEISAATESSLDSDGANIPGFHLEGPYVSEKYKGAMSPVHIRYPDREEFFSFPNIKLVTLAPELPGSMELIRECTEKGIPVSLGHTACNFQDADEAFKAGAACVTHAFNAMPPFHHREPSLLGAAIQNNAYVQVISDGMHLHPTVVTALYRIFGPEKMVLISDSMCATGLPDGDYAFAGQDITVKDGAARTPFGALAGSTFSLYKCVKAAVSFGLPKADVLKMASATPAKMMGLNKGIIAVGADADFIVLEDDLTLRRTVIAGKTVFEG